MEPNPYRAALFNISLLAFAAVFLFGLLALVNLDIDPVAVAALLWWAGSALTVGVLFMALWLVASAIRYEAPAGESEVAAAQTESDGREK